MIEAKDITKQYDGHLALRKFSCRFEAGKVTGLLGPNGAGKTTFLRILNQILRPDEGTVLIDNRPLEKEHIKKIGYLPEERGLYKKMRVLRQIVYFARLKGLDKATAIQQAMDWLDRFQLTEWKSKRIGQLSKGMAQKVQFIITVIHDPDIVILDEPFSGFDPINTNLVKKEILRLRDAGKTVIVSTHNMNSVEEICDQIVLLNQGRKILDGHIKNIRETYRPNVYQITFKGNIIGFTNALWAGYELIDREQLGNEHFAVTIRLLNDNTVNDLLQTVIPFVKVQSIREVLPGMNEIFIKAIGQE